MDISITRTDLYTIVALAGNLDAMTSPEAEAKIMDEVAVNNKIILDLNSLDYISSAGLRVMLNVAKAIQSQGGMLALLSLTDQVKEVFDISGFSTIFNIYNSLSEAKSAFK